MLASKPFLKVTSSGIWSDDHWIKSLMLSLLSQPWQPGYFWPLDDLAAVNRVYIRILNIWDFQAMVGYAQ